MPFHSIPNDKGGLLLVGWDALTNVERREGERTMEKEIKKSLGTRHSLGKYGGERDKLVLSNGAEKTIDVVNAIT